MPGEVASLHALGAPWCLVVCVCLLSWCAQLEHSRNLDFIVFFAGQAAISNAMRSAGVRTVAYDITYCGKGMDLCSAAGMACGPWLHAGGVCVSARSLRLTCPRESVT